MKTQLIYLQVALVSFCLIGCNPTPQQIQKNALSEAEKYANKLEWSVVDCSGIDSDDNKYVTCTFKDPKTSIIRQAECAYDPRVGVGCKSKN